MVKELKQELERIKGLVKNLEGKIEALELEKEDKFAELKEAYKNGAVIQFRRKDANSGWYTSDVEPLWLVGLEYRIKPEEEKPNIGDVCKFWNASEDKYSIGVLIKNDKSRMPYQIKHGNYFINAKKLTKQEAIELLFGKEANNE